MGEPTATTSTGQTADSPERSGSYRRGGASEGRQGVPLASRAAVVVQWRDSMRLPRRPKVWIEVLLVAVSYWVYSLIRNAVPEQEAVAMRHADQIWRIEEALGIAVERAVNHAANSVTWLIVGMNYYYATLHFIVTIGVLVWLYRRHPGRYSPARLALFATTGIALLGYYFYPLAPPRLMGAGFIDTVVVHNTWGSMASGDLANVSNQYAAMPSMHIGWSLWCGITLAVLAERTWVKVLGVLYPGVTLIVIVATANHFWLDAVGGAACLALGFGVSYTVHGRAPHHFPRHPVPGAEAGVARIPAAQRPADDTLGAAGSREVEARAAGADGKAVPTGAIPGGGEPGTDERVPVRSG